MEELEQNKQERILDRNRKITRITLFILFIVLVLIFGRLLLMVVGIG